MVREFCLRERYVCGVIYIYKYFLCSSFIEIEILDFCLKRFYFMLLV